MIRCLLIGNSKDIQFYSKLIAALNYFGEQKFHVIDDDSPLHSDIDFLQHDAFFFVSPMKNIKSIFEKAIRAKGNIYFVDQSYLTTVDINELFNLHYESNNLLYTEVKELKHPLVQEFINTSGSHLLFRYNKDISSKKKLRPAILSALCFLTILSPVQVKKVDVNSMETTEEGRPAFKIRLKMYDSSLGYIIVKMENKNEHNIIIESKPGNFIFNFAENYLENIHGMRFKSEPTTDSDLILKNLESFALCIILNKKPLFTFYHYTLSYHLLTKIENILLQSL